MSEGPVLHERDLIVLAKMLAMLGTSNDAERSVVGAKVHAWVSQRGVVWADLLIPPEPPEVEVKVNVGGRPAAASGNGAAAPQRPAQAPGGSGGPFPSPPHNWAPGPAWGSLVEAMLQLHGNKLKGDREVAFLTDQMGRGMKYGNGTRLSDKQEQWMRDILGRAGLTW
jgi:hypothetical protein